MDPAPGAGTRVGRRGGRCRRRDHRLRARRPRRAAGQGGARPARRCLVRPPPAPAHGGPFRSAARNRTVGYTLAYPPGYKPGDTLPLVIMLHGYGGNHSDALVGMSPAQAVAIKTSPLKPIALASVDGGNGYWTPHPGDDPMAMVIGEFIPLCQRLGLGRPPHPIATMGISMGGYGALLLAEKYPDLIAAAAAFAANDAVTHAAALTRRPVRVASAYDDPFYPGVQVLARALPPGAAVDFAPGCHTNPFFLAQEPPSLAFLAAHLTSPPMITR